MVYEIDFINCGTYKKRGFLKQQKYKSASFIRF